MNKRALTQADDCSLIHCGNLSFIKVAKLCRLNRDLQLCAANFLQTDVGVGYRGAGFNSSFWLKS